MASARKGRSQGPGAGRLLGIFFLLAMAMGAVFALGYMLGRSQYDADFRAAVTDIAGAPSASAHTKPLPKSLVPSNRPARTTADKNPDRNPEKQTKYLDDRPAPAAADWDFYHSAEPAKPNEKLRPQPQPDPLAGALPARPPAVPARSKRQAGKLPASAPIIPKGSIVLQVAAVTHESDALAMAQTLRQKKFPAFVLSPDADKFYRVQVGPYPDAKSANAARQRLEAAGFKPIIKK